MEFFDDVGSAGKEEVDRECGGGWVERAMAMDRPRRNRTEQNRAKQSRTESH